MIQQQFTGNLVFINQDQKTTFQRAAIVPAILKKQSIFIKQRRNMLENYRSFVQQHNDKCNSNNKLVHKYNIDVNVFVEQHQLHQEQSKAIADFKETVGKVSVSEYNKAAQLFNNNNGKLLLLLKEHKPIRKAIEHTFAMIVHKYAMQIDEKNNILERCGATTTRGLQKVKINHYELANTTINGVLTLPYHERTIHNHIKRLVDAGVLFDYTFHGHQKPVEYHVNSQILQIFDVQNSKTLNTEKQAFKCENLKNLHNNEIVTRADLNNIKINKNVDNHSLIKGEIDKLFQSMTLPKGNDFYKITLKPKKFEKPAAEKIDEISPKNQLSEFLRENTQDVQEFCEDLTKGVYDNHRFTLRKHLETEVYRGNMTNEEFRCLLVQEFLKIAGPIWKTTQPTIATWRKAYNLVFDTQIINNNGTIPSKNIALYMFDNLVWRLNYAKRFFRKFKEYQPLFPSQYFDPSRKTKKSGGFAYTIEALKKHQIHEKNREKRKQLQANQAAKRNLKYTAIELVEKKINALKNNKITLDELHNYVNNNSHIPIEVRAKLPLYIQRVYQA